MSTTPQLGMNMLLWSTDVSDTSYSETFAMLREAGYEGIEVPLLDPEPAKAERTGERLRELGLVPLGVTARSEDRARSALTRPCGVRLSRRETRDRRVRRPRRPRSCAVRSPRHLGVFSGRGPTADERQRSAETLHAASEYAAEHSVTLVVEYRFELYLVNCAADAALMREVDHPNCRLMYDTFHAHIEEKHPRAALTACADVLVHVHASENDRGTPAAARSTGTAPSRVSTEIGYDGWVVVEAFSDALPELAAATEGLAADVRDRGAAGTGRRPFPA